jgi:hypothetical protein
MRETDERSSLGDEASVHDLVHGRSRYRGLGPCMACKSLHIRSLCTSPRVRGPGPSELSYLQCIRGSGPGSPVVNSAEKANRTWLNKGRLQIVCKGIEEYSHTGDCPNAGAEVPVGQRSRLVGSGQLIVLGLTHHTQGTSIFIRYREIPYESPGPGPPPCEQKGITLGTKTGDETK